MHTKREKDETISFTNEIIISEKDIKGQGLEMSVNEIAIQKFKKNAIFTKKHFISITFWLCRRLMTVAYIALLLYLCMILLGENSVTLSGGQKQRLSIARAFLLDSKIMMFDESTSSLDNLTQEKITLHLNKFRGNKTIIMVAHRLPTIKNVDVIFFVESGEIVDTGTFESLIKTNENFKRIFELEDN